MGYHMNESEFCNHLKKQLRFLERSCNAFDSGDHDEAIRIATIARILLHDTRSSTSLLTYLGKNDIKLLSTTPPTEFSPKASFFDGVCSLPSCHPKLGSSTYKEDLPVDIWWGQVTMIVSRDEHMSRSKIILSAANKDGGAHVDKKLPDDYRKMKEGVWTKFSASGEEKIPDHNLKALRQIGYELLNSSELTEICI